MESIESLGDVVYECMVMWNPAINTELSKLPEIKHLRFRVLQGQKLQ
jgi:hypothetical protein